MDIVKTDILPFIDYVNNQTIDHLRFTSEIIDDRTGRPFIDDDNDFKVGMSGGFLMNLHFKFIDTHLFAPAAIAYEKNKKDPSVVNMVNSLIIPDSESRGKYYYCPHLSGTPEYHEFWNEETRRRKGGYTAKCKLLKTGEVVDIHITGDHYDYLNYGRILRTPNKEEQKKLHSDGDYKTTQVEAFPRFWDGDYWNFKIDLFIARNGYHLAKGKARGKGYSYKRGNQAGNTINLIPKCTIVLTAYNINYLIAPQATSDMLKIKLDWYEDNTHWRRFFLSENLESIELGYKKKKGGNKKFGYRSKALSVSLHNNESAAIGKRAIEIDFEEAGKCPNLEEALGVTMSSTEVGAVNVGTIRVYGTAGTKDSNWKAFANVFFAPKKYKMMPFENIWDVNGRGKTCGFFHPQVWNMEPYMDEFGNSLLDIAYRNDLKDKENQSKVLDTGKYIVYVGQRANTPEEAFRRGGENIFSSIELSNHASTVFANRDLQSYRDGKLIEEKTGLVFRTNTWLKHNGLAKYAHDYIEDVPFNVADDFQGCIREYYPPRVIDGEIPSNLYYVIYDPISKDKTIDTVIKENSLVSITVMAYPNNIDGVPSDLPVACYAGRPPRGEDADKIFLHMCRYYKAKGLVEINTGNTVGNFRKWGQLNKLYKDPSVVLSDKQKRNITPGYGMHVSGDDKIDGLSYFRDWLYTLRSVDEHGNNKYTFHYIYDIPLLKELLNFTINGNFDRISSMLIGMFLLKAMQINKKNDLIKDANSNNNISIYEEIGLYGYVENRNDFLSR